jgi:hypothetical protein
MSYPATTSETPNAIFARLFAERAIAVAHVGYEQTQAKHGVACLADGPALTRCCLRDAATGAVLLADCPLGPPGPVAGWAGQSYQAISFSACTTPCTAVLEGCDAHGGLLTSAPFVIGAGIHATAMPQAILSYFQSQRCAGKYDLSDRALGFAGAKVKGTADVHGGWYDASGDVSKYLSHLSYTNYMNPQQTPLFVWALARAADSLADAATSQGLRAEACWGADFLMRMCRPEGMFCMTVFDRWTGDPAQREICSYSTQQGHKHDSWECGWRQGGGMAIAALARVARGGLAGDFAAKAYLATAERAFDHLLTHGLAYLDDGRENIIDDYCGLLAAHELALTTGNRAYGNHAARRAEQLLARMSAGHGRDGWWRSGDDDARPFTHAADEGLPLLALALYCPKAPAALQTLIKSALVRAAGLLAVTTEVHNPCAYPRHFTRLPDGSTGTQFFFSHVNESGYWWQGENARLASLACALRAIAPLVALPPDVQALPERYLGWMLGANPFHSSMMHGFGRNHSHYLPAKTPTTAGAICNGITSGMTDETAIAYCPTEDPFHSWRWSELWLPHAAWFLLAITEPGAAAAAP